MMIDEYLERLMEDAEDADRQDELDARDQAEMGQWAVNVHCPVLSPPLQHTVYRYTTYEEAKDFFDLSVKQHEYAAKGLRLHPDDDRRVTVTLTQSGVGIIHKERI